MTVKVINGQIGKVQAITVNPKLTQQTISPSGSYKGFSTTTCNNIKIAYENNFSNGTAVIIGMV